MISLTEEEKTAQRKAEMVEELEQEAFEAYYQDLAQLSHYKLVKQC